MICDKDEYVPTIALMIPTTAIETLKVTWNGAKNEITILLLEIVKLHCYPVHVGKDHGIC